MFLFSINACCEGNKDRLCKTMRKIFHYERHSKRPPRGNKHKPCGDSVVFKRCFDFGVRVKSETRALDFFCGGRHLENPTEKESSDHFGLPAPFCQLVDFYLRGECYILFFLLCIVDATNVRIYLSEQEIGKLK